MSVQPETYYEGDKSACIRPELTIVGDDVGSLASRQTVEVVPGFTANESETLRIVAQGRSNSEIASATGLAVSAAQVRTSRLKNKLHAEDRSEIVKHANAVLAWQEYLPPDKIEGGPSDLIEFPVQITGMIWESLTQTDRRTLLLLADMTIRKVAETEGVAITSIQSRLERINKKIDVQGVDEARAWSLLHVYGEDVRVKGALSKLRGKDLAILVALAQGKTQKEVGDDISRSKSTMSWKVGKICEELGVESLHEALSLVYDSGLTERPEPQQRLILNDRRIRILQLIREGKTRREIGAELDIKEGSVTDNIQEIFQALGVNNRTYALKTAEERGILKESDTLPLNLLEQLSSQEKQIFEVLSYSLNITEAAATLGLNPSTISSYHLKNICTKLGVENTTQLLVLAKKMAPPYELVAIDKKDSIFDNGVSANLLTLSRLSRLGKTILLPNPESEFSLKPEEDANLLDMLTLKELDVLGLLSLGLQNKKIAKRLFIEEQTIKFHLGNIYKKLSVTDRFQAGAKARQLGIFKRAISASEKNGQMGAGFNGTKSAIDALEFKQDIEQSPIEGLSRREAEVLNCICDGLSHQETAERLNIADQTVKFHASKVYKKLGVENKQEAIIFKAFADAGRIISVDSLRESTPSFSSHQNQSSDMASTTPFPRVTKNVNKGITSPEDSNPLSEVIASKPSLEPDMPRGDGFNAPDMYAYARAEVEQEEKEQEKIKDIIVERAISVAPSIYKDVGPRLENSLDRTLHTRNKDLLNALAEAGYLSVDMAESDRINLVGLMAYQLRKDPIARNIVWGLPKYRDVALKALREVDESYWQEVKQQKINKMPFAKAA
jgi:DNA-binding NarL/FixJ family response regulator